MTAITRPATTRMTRDEFVQWDAPSELRWQLIDGETIETAPANRLHGAIQMELGRLIANFLAERHPSAQVVAAAGVVPRVRAEFNFRIPDLAVTFEEPGAGTFVDAPTVLIEIMSPSNETDTRTNVWAYTTIASVQEILLLRSSRWEAELLRRNEDGTWPADPILLRGNASLVLQSIGFATPLAAVYRTTGLKRLATTSGVRRVPPRQVTSPRK